ncbi:MAG: DHHA1 domain-containing protein, partial [Acholeplasmataceae bacterium]
YAASILTKNKIEFQEINDFLYLESLSDRLARNKFKDFLLTKNNVAYRFNDYKMVLESKLTFNHISRGFVNSMAGITEVYIWANFTENEEGKVIAELRSRKVGIVDIAKKYGGGGHLHACGATLKDFNEAKLLLNDLDERIKSYDFKNNL